MATGDYVLLIIDPQNDFHEGGNLAVIGTSNLGIGGEGGIKDSEKIIDLINKRRPAAVYVSLDTHTPTHIGHQQFWQPEGNPAGEGPGPGSNFIVVDHDGTEKVAVSVQGQNVFYEPRSTGNPETDEELKVWVIKYVKTLTSGAKFSPCIWPNHCLESSDGHKVYPQLKTALDKLKDEGVTVEYHIKGQNEATEMYSIFKAELPAEGNAPESLQKLYRGKHTDKIDDNSKIIVEKCDEEDHANVKTDFNTGLYNSLVSNGFPIVICGEALSHCVKWSTLDLVSKKLDEKNKLPLYLLENASSVVNLSTIGLPETIFVNSTKDFKKESTDNGVVWTTTDDFLKLPIHTQYLIGTQSSLNRKRETLGEQDKRKKNVPLYGKTSFGGRTKKRNNRRTKKHHRKSRR
jgi:nicotinamidase/pyrazinamidase